MAINNQHKPSKYDADVIIIGSGAGGGIVMQSLANHNLKVILVEEHKLGGDCVNYSCIPTKALLESVNTFNHINNAHKFGVKVGKANLDFDDVKYWVKRAINNTGINNGDSFSRSKINHVVGHAHFINPYTISVGLKRLTAKKFIIATGASNYIPDIAGLNNIDFITYKSFLELKKIPNSVAIIGGGSVGYEFAQIFTAFGAKVHLFEKKNHILPDNDPEVSDLAESILTDSGVRMHTNSFVTSIKKTTKATLVHHTNHGQDHSVAVDSIFIATGNKANTDIGLENALVTYNDDGIKVNNKLQTSQKHIYAVGDVLGNINNASSAIKQGQIVAHNIVHRKEQYFNNLALPHVTFGYPEIASVGITEKHIKLSGKPYQTSIAPIGIVGKSFTTDYQAGFVKIVASHTGNILGASIVAPHAGELISELSVMVEKSRKACDISSTIHPFSTWSEAIRVACSKIYCI